MAPTAATRESPASTDDGGPTDGHGPTGPSRRGPGFALLGTCQVTLIYTLAVIAVPLPHIGDAYGLRRADLILLNAAYGLTFAGLLLFGGRLADRYGGRRVLTVGLLTFAAASLAAPLAPTYPVLLAARFLQGAGAALVAPAAMAVLRALFPTPAAYDKAMGTWGGLSVIGATAGNLLSGVLSALAGWRLALTPPLVVALLALALAPRLLPSTPSPQARRAPRLDPAGAALATIGITLASYGLVVTEAHAWSSASVLVPLLVGVSLLAAFVLVEVLAERRARDPLLPPDFLRSTRRTAALAAIALTATCTAITFVLLSLHLQQVRGWSALETSYAFVPFAAALLTTGRIAGPLIGRIGAPSVTAVGLGTAATGMLLLGTTGHDPATPYAVGLLPGLLLLAVGAAASFAGAAVLAVRDVPGHQTGLAGGVMNTAMELGPTVVLSVLLTLGDDSTSLAAAGTGMAALACLVAATHRRPRTV